MAGPSRHANSNMVTTTILISNIHCPSCVKTIQDTLEQYETYIAELVTSTVTQTVTVKHSTTLPAATIAKALYDAGFDVQSMWEQRGHSRASMFSLSWLTPNADVHNTDNKLPNAFLDFSCGLLPAPDQHQKQQAKHSTYCKQCAAEEHAGVARTDSRARLTAIAEEESSLNEEALVEVVSCGMEALCQFKVVISIHGMTCSSCVGRVAEVLKDKSCVEEVNVNLLNESATLIINDKSKVADLVEEVEDIGYEAALESCQPLSSTRYQPAENNEPDARSVTLRIIGIYCEHCPAKISHALKQLRSDIVIVKQATLQDPLLTISYLPRPPDFTIRQIMTSISRADSALRAEIYSPPSLEERARTLQAQHRRGIARRLTLSFILAIPTFVFGVVFMSLLSSDDPLRLYWTTAIKSASSPVGRIPRVQWPLLACSTIVYLFAADIFHRRALHELYMMWRPGSKFPLLRRFYRFGSMDMLLSLGTTIAYVGSIVVLILSAAQTSASTDDMDTTTYFDAVVFLTMFLLMGRLLEAYGKMQTADAVNSLSNLRASSALLLSSTKGEHDILPAEQVPVEHLEVDDTLVIPPGSSPPCDGVVIWNSTSFDESSLTGEARPVTKREGDEVFTGSINLSNAVHIRVTKTVGISLLDRIIDTVREGQSKRAPIERIADVLTGYFVPLIVLIAACDWLIWLILGYAGYVPYVGVGLGGWTFWSLQFAISVLVVACPCGIGLAAPTALFVGTGIAAKHGVLVRGGGEAFQEASELDCVVFDKTGTITEGSVEVTDHQWLGEQHQDSVLAMAAALESMSSHPLAKAIGESCTSTISVDLQDCVEVPGRGMTGRFTIGDDVMEICVGNQALMEEHDIFMTPQAVSSFRAWSAQGKTVIFVGYKIDNVWSLSLMLAASDPIRAEAEAVIKAIQARNIDVWLLSGDNITTAQAVANDVGIVSARVIAGVMPEQKAEKIRYLQRSQQKHKSGRAIVAMVGDGINDAPALATADVGIAMGTGSDTAISTAGFVLLTSDLCNVVTLLKLSRSVIRRIKFNFGWAMGYNLIMLPIAAGVLFPATSNGSHIRLDPVWASLAMALSSVSVVTSSLLLKTKLPIAGFDAGHGI